ncbi:hypothetical protein RHSIM_Rhsim07G0131300 [Rhododendron simsii]|uniref:Plastid lipid-associated protein/fibrillin conserved domain-containing protein n=1 Tax=Rhododendron simsii TaxID=118357 RepID=A0A834LLA9_RHOSS|nr:hypothetical protein RHSIM_Rhsim07G0131300 [Rhododendron simsii]
MALLLSSPPSLLTKNPNTQTLPFFPKPHSLSFSLLPKLPILSSLRFHSTFFEPLSASSTDDYVTGDSPSEITDEWGEKSAPEIEPPPSKLPDADPPGDEDEWGGGVEVGAVEPPSSSKLRGDSTSEITDEWGEKSAPEIEPPPSKLPDADPPGDEDEWGGGDAVGAAVAAGDVGRGERGEAEIEPPSSSKLPDAGVNGSAAAAAVEEEDDEVAGLKRRLVDMVYGTDFGFRASTETRAEVLELVTRLEASNPTPAPTGAAEILDGNWVLVYATFSELLPLLAAGTTPLLKVKSICQAINTSSLTIENSTNLSSPFATFSFSASATFEIRTPTTIQVEFKEGSLQPPAIKSTIDLPKKVDILGQQIDLSPVQQSLNPLQEAVASIARAISGQPPLKIPIPGGREKSWLLITYLDKDFRISRGDGGLFVLAKEGSPLLDQ